MAEAGGHPIAADTAPADPAGWVDRHGDYLYRFALARVRDPAAAEDVVQDTLLAAWAGRAGFAGRAAERSWLTGILKRKAANWLRRRVRDRLATGTPPADSGGPDDPFTARGKWKRHQPEWAAGPAGNLNRAEFWDVLDACLGALPARQREVFALRYLDDTAGPDICRDLGVSPANLWVMLHRSRVRVAGCLSARGFGNPCAGGDSLCP